MVLQFLAAVGDYSPGSMGYYMMSGNGSRHGKDMADPDENRNGFRHICCYDATQNGIPSHILRAIISKNSELYTFMVLEPRYLRKDYFLRNREVAAGDEQNPEVLDASFSIWFLYGLIVSRVYC